MKDNRTLVLGIVLIAAGTVGFLVVLVGTLISNFSGLERVDAPGRRELPLEAGPYTLYWDMADSLLPRMPQPGDVRVSVVSASDGRPANLSPSSVMNGQYSLGGRIGIAILAVEIPVKGVYTITVQAAPGRTLPEGAVAVGHEFSMLRLARLIAISIAIAAAGVGPGIALLIRRSKRLDAAAPE